MDFALPGPMTGTSTSHPTRQTIGQRWKVSSEISGSLFQDDIVPGGVIGVEHQLAILFLRVRFGWCLVSI